MMPNSEATTIAQAAQPSGPPQRQSCDRCHKQKLRCTRNKNSNGDGCDRCLSKRAQCVYSISLPKGRPSLRRLTIEEPSASNTDATGDTERTPGIPLPNPNDVPISSATAAPAILPQAMDTSIDMSMCMWPWLDTASWDGIQPELGWAASLSFPRANVDDLLLPANGFESEGSAYEGPGPFSPTQSSSTPSPPHPRIYQHGQPGIGNYERQDGSTRNDTERGMGSSTMSMFPDKNASLVIAQLSQLSVHLSSLRSTSYTLAQAADASFGHLPNDGHVPLIDSTAFETVAAWLAHEQNSSNIGNAHRSVSIPNEISNPWSSSTQRGPNILRDVFSASHHLMEILRHLQADDITRHLVMACEALLLEIYAAILTALQHEAYPGDSMNSTALGNVRLVLVVQLCAYLIERQHHAVDQCLTSATAQKHNAAGSVSNSSFQSGTADRESLRELKIQVRQKLARLRQLLRCP